MIHGIGIDIIETDRIEKQFDKSDPRFFEMIFTEIEIGYCSAPENRHVRAQRFAARFAAKEAFLKALGTGLRDGLRWKDIEVTNDSLGKPSITLYEEALRRVRDRNITRIHLTLSHNKSTAAAAVILED